MKKRVLCFVSVMVLCLPSIVVAASTPTLSGMVSLGGVFIDSSDNLSPSGSKNVLGSLDGEADSKNTTKVFALPRLTWNAGGDDGLTLHLDPDAPIDEAGDFVIGLGASTNVDSVGVISGGFFYNPFENVWKDPYLVGEPRRESDRAKYGLHIGLEGVLGTGFAVKMVYLKDEVDDDLIGKRMPELARDGSVYGAELGYSLPVSRALILTPGVTISTGDYTGDANSYSKCKLSLKAQYVIMAGKIVVLPEIYLSRSDYDDMDPIFGKTRTKDNYGAKVMATYMKPFNLEDWSLSGLLALDRGDANIDFYNTESMVLGTMVNYHF